MSKHRRKNSQWVLLIFSKGFFFSSNVVFQFMSTRLTILGRFAVQHKLHTNTTNATFNYVKKCMFIISIYTTFGVCALIVQNVKYHQAMFTTALISFMY